MKLMKNIILVISIIALLFQFYVDISPIVDFSLEGRVMIVLIEVFGFLYVYFWYRNKVDEKIRQRYFKYLIWLLLSIYLINLIYLLFLDGELGRDIRFLENIDEYMKYNVNLKPFHTIKLFINSYYQGNLPLTMIAVNLMGNLVAFMPFAFFLPILFSSQNKWYNIFITMSFIIVLAEIIQVFTMTGSGDIDDYILNIIGSMIAYFILMYLKGKRK